MQLTWRSPGSSGQWPVRQGGSLKGVQSAGAEVVVVAQGHVGAGAGGGDGGEPGLGEGAAGGDAGGGVTAADDCRAAVGNQLAGRGYGVIRIGRAVLPVQHHGAGDPVHGDGGAEGLGVGDAQLFPDAAGAGFGSKTPRVMVWSGAADEAEPVLPLAPQAARVSVMAAAMRSASCFFIGWFLRFQRWRSPLSVGNYTQFFRENQWQRGKSGGILAKVRVPTVFPGNSWYDRGSLEQSNERRHNRDD